jgi:hypothetical protein
MSKSESSDDTSKRRIPALVADGVLSVREASPHLELHRTNVYRLCKRNGIEPAAARQAFVRRSIESAVGGKGAA